MKLRYCPRQLANENRAKLPVIVRNLELMAIKSNFTQGASIRISAQSARNLSTTNFAKAYIPTSQTILWALDELRLAQDARFDRVANMARERA